MQKCDPPATGGIDECRKSTLQPRRCEGSQRAKRELEHSRRSRLLLRLCSRWRTARVATPIVGCAAAHVATRVAAGKHALVAVGDQRSHPLRQWSVVATRAHVVEAGYGSVVV